MPKAEQEDVFYYVELLKTCIKKIFIKIKYKYYVKFVTCQPGV